MSSPTLVSGALRRVYFGTFLTLTLCLWLAVPASALPIYIGRAQAELTVGNLVALPGATGARTTGRIENHFDPEKCGFSEGHYLSQGLVTYTANVDKVLFPFVNFLLTGLGLLDGDDPNNGLDIIAIAGLDEGSLTNVTSGPFRAQVNTDAKTHGDDDADVAIMGPVNPGPAVAAAASEAGPTAGKAMSTGDMIFAFLYRSQVVMIKNGNVGNPIPVFDGEIEWDPLQGLYIAKGDFQQGEINQPVPGAIDVTVDVDRFGNVPVNAVNGDVFQFFTLNEAFMRTEFKCIPEPSTLALSAGALALLVCMRRRRGA
jgi:hypothetical protein